MTTIRLKPSGPAPATHALVIGVGYYRHFRGGPEPRPNVHYGLPVLESPPRSAEQLVQLLLGIDPTRPGKVLANPAAPLATVDVLISARTPVTFNVGGVDHVAEGATSDAVDAAFDRWLNEVKRHDDNIGILYFCGHGLTGTGPEQFLLLENHGENANNPLRTGSFDLTNTVRALCRQVPAQLYVFVDACRTFNATVATTLGARPAPLLAEEGSTANVNLGTTMIQSTREGLAAYGDGAGISRFTDALLNALGDGYCGVSSPGTQNWLVNGEALSQAMPRLLAVINRQRGGDPQSCTPQPSGPRDLPLHVLTQPPRVKVEIVLRPERYQRFGGYLMSDRLGLQPSLAGGNVDGEWKTDAVRSIYQIRVQSPTKAFDDYVLEMEPVDPPTYRLEVSR